MRCNNALLVSGIPCESGPPIDDLRQVISELEIIADRLEHRGRGVKFVADGLRGIHGQLEHRLAVALRATKSSGVSQGL